MSNIPSGDTVRLKRNEARKIKNNIDDLIQKERYDEICVTLSKTETEDVALFDQELYILCMLAKVLELELQTDPEHNLFEDRTTTDIVMLFRKTVLFLRRIEFNLPKQFQIAIRDYFFDEKISMTALYGIIYGAKSIRRKEQVWKKVSDMIILGEG